MNRDERRTRPRGFTPAEHCYDGVRVLHPSEPRGGSWIAVNDARLCFALINWYSVGRRVQAKTSSRGRVVVRVSRAKSLAAARAVLEDMPLARTNPFRLIGVSLDEQRIQEWRWDLKSLDCLEHPWRSRQWISSGHDEPGAQNSRSRVFRRMLRLPDAGAPGWLRRLHASHGPRRGPYSTCMHRPEATTVSYTEVAVTPGAAIMRHANQCPCQSFIPLPPERVSTDGS